MSADKKNKPIVLIVDDKLANLMVLEQALEDIDCEIVKANSGQEALSECLNHQFACILLDVQMPDMDGFETAELIKKDKQKKQVPIIFITAHIESPERILKGYQLGAVDYITKPIDIETVVTKVAIYCELFRQRDAIELSEELRKLNKELKDKSFALEDAYKQLEVKNNEILELFRFISHELMTPVGTINAFAATLHEKMVGNADKTGKEYLEIIMESCQQLRVYVNDLLDVSRLDKRKIVLEPKTYNSGQLLEKILVEYKEKCKEQDIELKSNLNGVNQNVLVDENRFYQVVTNLVNNALKFTKEGSIEIGTKSSDDPGFVEFYVKDTGRGIPEEDTKQIFEMLYQCKGGEDEKIGGLGLGLTLVKGLVNLHGGEIKVDSKPGEGSTFSFTMPVSQ